MHKKGITEEVAKKRSRRTVKHQRGIVGADLATIAAKRNQSLQIRTQQRVAAISKAKEEKKAKEAKKEKTKVCLGEIGGVLCGADEIDFLAGPPERSLWTKSVEAADEGRQGRSLTFDGELPCCLCCIVETFHVLPTMLFFRMFFYCSHP